MHCDYSGKEYDSTSPSHEGAIGKHFKYGLDLKPIVKFKSVPGLVEEYDDDFISSFNCDHKYFHQICRAVQNGWRLFPANLVFKVVGHAHKGRYVCNNTHHYSCIILATFYQT